MAIKFLNTVAVDTDVLYVNATNNRVGIKTVSPDRALQVGDGTEDDSIRVLYSDASYMRLHGYGLYMSRAASYIRPVASNAQTLYIGHSSHIWNTTVHNANTHAFQKGTNDWMRITSSGNVGIGTTSPNAKLDVVINGASGNVASFKSGATGSGDYAGITLHTQTVSSVDRYGSELRSINTAGTPGYLNPRLGLFTQDTNTYLPADRTEKMSILGSGNVGIGTTNPQDALDIDVDEEGVASDNSGIRVRAYRPHLNLIDRSGYSTTNGHNFQIKADNAKLQFNATSADNETFDLVRMVINNDGNVGIGINNPVSKIHTYSADVNVTATFESGDADSWINIKDNASGLYGVLLGAQGNDFRISPNNTERMRVTSTGKVGIGATNPGAKLHLATSGEVSLDLEDTGGQRYRFFVRNSDKVFGIYDVSSPKTWFRYTGNATRSSTKLALLEGGGNVGIGTATPDAKLEVNGTININNSGDRVFIADPSQGTFSLGDLDALSSEAQIIGNGVDLLFKNDDTTTMVATSNNRVGIGTTSPAYALDVNGRIQSGTDGLQIDTGGYGYIRIRPYYGSMNTSTSLYVGGVNGYSYQPVYASAFNVNSDYRLKTNVVDLEEAIERIKQINVHRFNWKDRLDEEKVDGFLAHELAEVIPEAVTGEKDAVREDGTLDYQGVDQAKVVPLLTAALQEAILKIEQLETRIQTLENN